MSLDGAQFLGSLVDYQAGSIVSRQTGQPVENWLTRLLSCQEAVKQPGP